VLNIAPTEFGTGVRAALERHGSLDRERAPLRYLFLFGLDWDGDSARASGQPDVSRLALAS
jgi:hypothetical protein